MEKTFSRLVCMLLMALLLVSGLSLSALAESTAFPINPPPVFGEVPTQFDLFSGEPVDFTVTLQVDEETGLRTYTIPNPLEWGLAASVPGVWEYSDENGWQRTGDAAEGQVQLLLPADAYELEGCPLWIVPCTLENTQLSLNIYLGELRHLYAFVDYQFDGDVISITAEDHSFILNCAELSEERESNSSLYASYDPAGVLAYASHTTFANDGSLISYTVDADVQNQTYRLSDISISHADDTNLFWNHYDRQWQNGNYEPVDAPEGISPDNLPFTLTGGWVGIPFEQPGDQSEGMFPASALPADAAMVASQYKPWPEETDALYRNWAEAGAVPALPAASWHTGEDGSVTFTVTGLEPWGVQEAHMGDWRWLVETEDWVRGAESTPGQLTLTVPAGQDASAVIWDQPTANGDNLMLCLSRNSLMVEVCYTSMTGSFWFMDNQGGLVYMRPLDDRRQLEVTYDDFALLEYNLYTRDEQGNLLSQACYVPTDEDEAVFELGCYFRYSPEMNYQEALWIKDVGWYSYETGAPCDCPEGVDLAACVPFTLK